jgi:hypothetical protein
MEYLLDALNDVMRLEGFAVVLQNFFVHFHAGFGPDVARQLSGEVLLDGDFTLGPLEDGFHLGGMEWNQILDL